MIRPVSFGADITIRNIRGEDSQLADDLIQEVKKVVDTANGSQFSWFHAS